VAQVVLLTIKAAACLLEGVASILCDVFRRLLLDSVISPQHN
jgi:hypothetical protein